MYSVSEVVVFRSIIKIHDVLLSLLSQPVSVSSGICSGVVVEQIFSPSNVVHNAAVPAVLYADVVGESGLPEAGKFKRHTKG